MVSMVMALALIMYPNNQVQAANVSLAVSASTVNIGDTVAVSVTVPENVTATVDLTFSSDVLSFVNASADVGTNGSTITMNVGKYSLAAANTITINFKANTSGSASVSASVVSAVDNNTAEETALSGASTTVTVANQTAAPTPTPQQPTPQQPAPETPAAQQSGDNSLSSLKISSGTLSPEFKYNVTNYTATVGYNVSSIVVSATASNAKATIESVTGNGNVQLQVGDNTIQVVVKAENGVKATYTIVVTRQAQGNETQEQPVPETPVVEQELKWNGQVLTVKEEIPEASVPADFTKSTVVVNNEEKPCLSFANGKLNVLYMASEDGAEGLYVYDEVQQLVYPFIKMESETGYVMVLLADPSMVVAPSGYQACTISVEGKGIIHAYQFLGTTTSDALDSAEVTDGVTSWFGAETVYASEPVATDFYLMYCMNNAGETGWYVYDSVEGTFQRYLASVHNPLVEDVEASVSETDEEYEKVVAELETAKNMQMIIIGVAAAVIVILIIVIIVMILKKRAEEDEYFNDYEEDEYDDDVVENEEDVEDDIDDDVANEIVQDEDTTTVEDEVEIEFYEMPQISIVETAVVEETADEEDDDEIELEFYEIQEEKTQDEDVFVDMEALLLKEAVAPEKEEPAPVQQVSEPVKQTSAPVKREMPKRIIEEDDDSDLEFIELD